MSQKILLSMGTRPEIIKMAPVYFELKRQGAEPIVLHTGQHSDMATSLYELFGITPDYSLDLEREPVAANCELGALSSLLLQKISLAIAKIAPSMVLVHGDTSSALMAALAAFYQQIPIAHVEAGLRSHNGYDPFPEEKNRVLVAQLAQWHFAPTTRARDNLLAEGISDKAIHVVGNTIVEAAQLGTSKIDTGKNAFITSLEKTANGKKLVLVTMHRRENQASNIKQIAEAVLTLMKKHEDLCVVWPVHPSPKVEAAVRSVLGSIAPELASRMHLTKPLDYPTLLWVLKNSWLVLTDSGGIQEEAVALHAPVLVLRDTTERPEVIEAGAGLLIGTVPETILSHVETLYNDSAKHETMRKAKNPFGNGTTAGLICNVLLKEKNVEKKSA
jgi:UDP-N-acetylglucosamine 2-epimerase (non-hydrolysing)